MRREQFWANAPDGTVRFENSNIVEECTTSEAKAIAKALNDVVAKFTQEARPIEKVKRELGKLTKEERRALLLMRYAVMYVLDHE